MHGGVGVIEGLKRTPLYESHLKYGAKLVEFGGWEMPVQYGSIQDEHKAVREAAGLFDVSHMGEFVVKGPQALDLIQRIVTNNAAKLEVGQCQYALMCNERGTVIDDLLVYRLGAEEYLIVVNAGNIEKDFAWWQEQAKSFPGADLKNISPEVAQLALQGPKAERVLQRLTKTDLSEIGYYCFKQHVQVAGLDCLVSRTGYTGEDGFEIYLPAADAAELWGAILEEGEDEGVLPCGLGARDTLRFEARLPLYGHELSEEITPLEAGVGMFVKLKKGVPFIGSEALERQKAEGVKRKLVGFEMVERGIARQGYPILHQGTEVGFVTTGSPSLTLAGKNLGLAIVPLALTEIGARFHVGIRGKEVLAQVVETPFVAHRTKRV